MFVLLLAGCFGRDGGASVGRGDARQDDTDTDSDIEDCDRDGHEELVCHIPPGNPDNAHNICVGDPAVPAHLRHGDFTGPCECIVRDGACEEGDRCCEEGDSCNEGFCTPPPDTGDTGDTGDTAEPPARAAALLNHSGPAPSGKGDWPGLFPP